jgi:hypothetical protein
MLKTTGSSNMRAYVFIETRPGMAWNVLHNLKKRKCVRQVDVINGPYEVIAVVEGDGASSVAMTILTGIRKLDGVADVVVYLAEKKGEGEDTPKLLHIRQAKKLLNKVNTK